MYRVSIGYGYRVHTTEIAADAPFVALLLYHVYRCCPPTTGRTANTVQYHLIEICLRRCQFLWEEA